MTDTTDGRPELEELVEAECLRLITPGGIGRLAYSGRYGPTVLPVNYRLYDGTIVFRTAQDSPTDEDLRTGIANAEYKVAFEIDEIDLAAREGWSVLVQGPMHHVQSETERASVLKAGVETWPGGALTSVTAAPTICLRTTSSSRLLPTATTASSSAWTRSRVLTAAVSRTCSSASRSSRRSCGSNVLPRLGSTRLPRLLAA
jgi:Pyridoxamine 5'-phosphate oxidase